MWPNHENMNPLQMYKCMTTYFHAHNCLHCVYAYPKWHVTLNVLCHGDNVHFRDVNVTFVWCVLCECDKGEVIIKMDPGTSCKTNAELGSIFSYLIVLFVYLLL